jgi:hypothetical protein
MGYKKQIYCLCPFQIKVEFASEQSIENERFAWYFSRKDYSLLSPLTTGLPFCPS